MRENENTESFHIRFPRRNFNFGPLSSIFVPRPDFHKNTRADFFSSFYVHSLNVFSPRVQEQCIHTLTSSKEELAYANIFSLGTRFVGEKDGISRKGIFNAAFKKCKPAAVAVCSSLQDLSSWLHARAWSENVTLYLEHWSFNRFSFLDCPVKKIMRHCTLSLHLLSYTRVDH